MIQFERRQIPRTLVSIRVSIHPDNGGLLTLPISGQLTDLNRAGATLHARETLRTGNACTLTLTAEDGAEVDLSARIVWARRNADWEYDAGLKFDALTPTQAALIDLYLAPVAS